MALTKLHLLNTSVKSSFFQGRHCVLSPCRSKSTPIDELWGSIRKEMLSHVDLAPKTSESVQYESPQVEQIKNSERDLLKNWNSREFHATGVAIAFVLAIFMLLNHPMSS